MDREEYKTKIDEARELLAKGSREEALDLLDNMNWRKVHNVNALLQAAEIYESGDRLQEARELLELAHERSPIGRMVIYRLALICIRLESYDEAKEYYDEFVEIAPHDSLKYIIRYQLNKAKGADDMTLIAILEELKEHDFHEEWAYELALLYHKTGQREKCIAACDELILWFGEGPYVESALELKLLYQPLDQAQEDKYRAFRAKKDGVMEIRPDDAPSGGEILNKPIEIPEVALHTEKFSTVNLQEAIKKNIEEIMQATETGEVSENMEAIKELVGDLPFAREVKKEPTEELPVIQAQERRINEELKNNFKEYLEEEYDGQMSIFVPDAPEIERQIAGQMTIDEIMADWERTSRAAEAALSDADAKRLENAKAKAIEEANRIMDKLEDARPKLDAGVAPTEVLKQEYLADTKETPKLDKEYLSAPVEATKKTIHTLEEEGPQEALKEAEADRRAAEKEALRKQDTFRIPKVAAEGGEEGIGLEIPIVKADEESVVKTEPERNDAVVSKDEPAGTKWEPKELSPHRDGGSTGDTKRLNSADVTKIVAGANDMLQKTLDAYDDRRAAARGAATAAGVIGATTAAEVGEDALARSVAAIMSDEKDRGEEQAQPPKEKAVQKPKVSRKIAPPDAFEDENEKKPEPAETSKPEELNKQPETAAKPEDTIEQGETVPKAEEQASATVEQADIKEKTDDKKEKPVVPDELPHRNPTTDLRRELENKIEISEQAISDAIMDEMPQKELTQEEKELFTYFTPIGGMETALCQVLTGARARLTRMKGSQVGNIIIQGSAGSGKTTLATSLIRVLQVEIGKPNRNIGRIDGGNLNSKDIAKLFARIDGGCLIIEKAGEITRDTTMELSAVMERDATNVLVILEDARIGIEKVMGLNPQFARKFTEKIIIPVLTIDELVNFGKAYAADLGYSIDEMGVLALYDRINLIQRLDHPTNLTEVKEIVDEAIDKAERGGLAGFFARKHRDEDGNIILQEKDFQER